MREALRGEALGKALVAPVAPGDMLTAAVCVASFDLGTMAPDDADFTASFELQSTAEQVRGIPCTSTLLGRLCDCQLACRAYRRNTAAEWAHWAPLQQACFGPSPRATPLRRLCALSGRLHSIANQGDLWEDTGKARTSSSTKCVSALQAACVKRAGSGVPCAGAVV